MTVTQADIKKLVEYGAAKDISKGGELPKGSHAIYIDDKEEEYLLPPNMKYKVVGVKLYKKREKGIEGWTTKGKAIVYYLKIA